MGFVNTKWGKQHRWLKEMYDEGATEAGDSANPARGFSVQRTFPIIKSFSGPPTYRQLMWAIDVIRLWADGVVTRRIPTYPSEAGATKQRGGYSGEQKPVHDAGNRDARGRKHVRAVGTREASAGPPTEPKAREARKAVDHLPQVQERNRHAQVRGKKRPRKGRPPRVRS